MVTNDWCIIMKFLSYYGTRLAACNSYVELQERQGKYLFQSSLGTRKTVFGVSDRVRHKPACAATEGS